MEQSVKKSFKYLTVSLVLIFIVVCVLGYVGYSLFKSPLFSSTKNEKNIVFIYPDSQMKDLEHEMSTVGTLNHPVLFSLCGKICYHKKPILAGSYRVDSSTSILKFFHRVVLHHQSPVKLTFNNIRFKEQLAQRLGNQLMMDSSAVMAVLTNDSLVEHYGFTENSIMAMFIPNTYEVYWTITPEQLANRMYKEYVRFWNTTRLAQAADIGLTPVEVSTLASIVEEETNKAKEKPIVAGLYINRIHQGIPLQSDPTVRFAVGDFSLVRILFVHLQFDSPYNTYKYKGLPPGPISLPSIQGIDAVLNYSHHNYLYMCAKETLNGEHNFASTLVEHNRNAAKYHVALKEWEKKMNK